MKNFKFNDINGFENIDTPNQLDAFELVSAKGLKDRYIFDFSIDPMMSTLYATWEISGYNQNFYWPKFNNLTYYNDNNWTITAGVPGDAVLVLKDKTPTTNFLDINYSKVETINKLNNNNTQQLVPYFNADTAIHLDTTGFINEVKYFRSGYLELTLKTNKKNCVIAYGSGKVSALDDGVPQTGEISYQQLPTSINSNIAYTTEVYSEINELIISLENGKIKLSYLDEYGNNKKSFSLIGNQNIADNEWHHIVINIGKPGIIRNHSQKYNEKFIEFWIDGKLDFKTNDYINKEQIFFPLIEWLGINAYEAFIKNDKKVWADRDYFESLYSFIDNDQGNYIGFQFYDRNVLRGIFNESSLENAFVGAFHTCIMGINTALSVYEIQERNRLYRGFEKNEQNSFIASANFISPTINTNKKKALKLFWNNLINKDSTHGIELDNNFDVYSYSVTHKTFNSQSEINNIDISNNKELKIISDIKVALKDNVALWKPGLIRLDDEHLKFGLLGKSKQWNLYDFKTEDSFYIDPETSRQGYKENEKDSSLNITFSGIHLITGDRILLTNQYNKKDNGIWIFNGYDKPLSRAEDAISPNQINNGIVRVTDGYYKDTTWLLSKNISSMNDPQEWIELEYDPTSLDINSQPIFLSRWQENNKEERFIDLEQDLNISDFDIIVFMNYPETNEKIKEHFIGYDDFEIHTKYNNFINSLKNVVANGSKLYVSSPKLAEDMGIIKKFTEISQELESSDEQSSLLSPFEFDEPAERFFDNNRINKYQVATTLSGLTNKETYLLTNFISYTPENIYDQEEYHAQYSYRQFGLQQGDEFIIPGSALRKVTINENLPGYKNNQIGVKNILAVAPDDIIAGTVVTKLQNNYYNGSTITSNPYDDYATTIIVHNNQLLDGQPITGKIFVNCIEDGYTFSREEYNKARIQNFDSESPDETVATALWQYSTRRLNRSPKKINIRQMTEYGQTTPTNGGGGAFIQAPSNASNGIIRSETDKDNPDYQSDLYPTVEEEIYTTTEIPTLSMTWLGLQWLAN